MRFLIFTLLCANTCKIMTAELEEKRNKREKKLEDYPERERKIGGKIREMLKGHSEKKIVDAIESAMKLDIVYLRKRPDFRLAVFLDDLDESEEEYARVLSEKCGPEIFVYALCCGYQKIIEEYRRYSNKLRPLPSGLSPLHMLFDKPNWKDLCTEALKLGADINQRSRYGLTPLAYVVRCKKNPLEMVTFCLENGADPNATVCFDKVTQDYYFRKRNGSMMPLPVNPGSYLIPVNQRSYLPLEYCDEKVREILLRYGAREDYIAEEYPT